jgi:hypothetical protein
METFSLESASNLSKGSRKSHEALPDTVERQVIEDIEESGV